MKEGILILCALLCMHVAYGYPAYFQDAGAAVAEEFDHPKPPKPQVIEQETMIAAEKENARPSPPGMAFMQMLNAMINGEFNAKAQQVSVPFGLKSTGWRVRLQLTIHNRRDEAIKFWWVDYNGNPVLYADIPSGGAIRQYSFGTHPWLITNNNGDLISWIVPYTSNMEVIIENTAAWSK